MLLTNRRHRVLFMALAAMEVAWFLPFALTIFIRWQLNAEPSGAIQLPAMLLYSGQWAPLLLFLLCWGAFLLDLVGADLLNRQRLASPGRELVMLALVVGTFLLTARLLLFPTVGVLNVAWLGMVVRGIYDQGPGSSVILFLLGLNLFLWFRVATATNRSLTFLSVGMSFRLGMLLALVGNALLIVVARQPTEQALLYLWLFFGFGLLAVALARVDEKAYLATQSSGATLPWGRLGQLTVMTAGAIALAIGGSLLYTPQLIRAVVGWFAPLWSLLGGILFYLFSALFLLLGPLMDRLIEAIRAILTTWESLANTEGELGAAEPMAEPISFGEIVNNVALVRYCLVTFILVGALLLIWLFFVRSHRDRRREEQELSDATGLATGGNSWQRLRDLVALLRSHGLRPGLLAAISVQNLYANVSRLAERRGHPRQPAQPPDEYLPTLRAAFPNQGAPLQRLTDAYMRVHYGDQPVTEAELAQLRSEYQTLRTAAEGTTGDGRGVGK